MIYMITYKTRGNYEPFFTGDEECLGISDDKGEILDTLEFVKEDYPHLNFWVQEYEDDYTPTVTYSMLDLCCDE